MKRVLVDTSVWVDHFRRGNVGLIDLLGLDLALMHPMVLAEIACGTPPSRTRTLADLARLQSAQQANLREMMTLVEREQLFGLGCRLVDLILLTSTLMTPGTELWTLDKRLHGLAERFSVVHRAVRH